MHFQRSPERLQDILWQFIGRSAGLSTDAENGIKKFQNLPL
jgi:hypothetical protein